MEKKEHKEYCQKCNEYVDYTVEKVNKTIKVKEETLDVEIYECYCAECGEKIFVYDYEKKNDVIVYDAYKKKVGLLTSVEIKEMRKKRHMTQIDLARFIGIGEKDITRYESGSIQNKCIDNLLRLVQDDDSYEEMVRVLYGESTSVWFGAKNINWNFYVFNNIIDCVEHNLAEELWKSPYEKIINRFIDKEERGIKEYERERSGKEVPVA